MQILVMAGVTIISEEGLNYFLERWILPRWVLIGGAAHLSLDGE
ncbi:MAG TPA: hypothetical protein VKB46_04880 [Pyrinomonadaceae bacterium]|nr:hypothetical protein [Pyrinomonadaceae bacterium]